MENDGDFKEIKRILTDSTKFFIRGYLIPTLALVVVLLSIFFIYVPYIQNIQDDYVQMQIKKQTNDNIQSRINTLSTQSSDLKLLDSNIALLNDRLPDQAKTAEVSNQIQNLVNSNHLTFDRANADTTIEKKLPIPNSINKNIQATSVSVSVSGTSSDMKKLFNDINSMKLVSYISNLSLSGSLSDNSSKATATFTVSSFALDSVYLQNSLDILTSPLMAKYSADDINKL